MDTGRFKRLAQNAIKVQEWLESNKANLASQKLISRFDPDYDPPEDIIWHNGKFTCPVTFQTRGPQNRNLVIKLNSFNPVADRGPWVGVELWAEKNYRLADDSFARIKVYKDMAYIKECKVANNLKGSAFRPLVDALAIGLSSNKQSYCFSSPISSDYYGKPFNPVYCHYKAGYVPENKLNPQHFAQPDYVNPQQQLRLIKLEAKYQGHIPPGALNGINQVMLKSSTQLENNYKKIDFNHYLSSVVNYVNQLLDVQ